MSYLLRPARLMTIALALLVATGLAGFGGSPRLAFGDNTVSIASVAFSTPSLTIAAGDTVTWVNNDAAVHNVTADDGSWSSGLLTAGASFSHTFTDPGVYTYSCTLHPGMTGTIVVNA